MSQSSFPITTRLEVKNFRSLTDVSIDLDRLTVFVGKNGAGKSNVVDAIRFIRDALNLGLDTAISNRHGMSAIRKWSAKGRPFDVIFKLSFKGIGWTGEYGFSLGSETRGEYRVKGEHCSIQTGRGTQTFELKEGKLLRAEFPDSPTQNELPDPDASLSPIQGTVPDHFMNWLTSSNPNTTLYLANVAAGNFHIIRRFIKSMGFYTLSTDLLREPQKPSNVTPLDEKGQNLSSVLREMMKDKQAAISTISQALGQIVPGIRDFSVAQVGGYFVTRLHHESGSAFELAQESDGTLRMLGILTALYQVPPRTLSVIEEPELTIHPGALGVLCDAIREASSFSQVLITTHSPDLIYHFDAENLRVVENLEGETQVGLVEVGQREAITKKLFAPGELMRMEGLRREIPHLPSSR
jgi:predicted ATPase